MFNYYESVTLTPESVDIYKLWKVFTAIFTVYELYNLSIIMHRIVHPKLAINSSVDIYSHQDISSSSSSFIIIIPVIQ